MVAKLPCLAPVLSVLCRLFLFVFSACASAETIVEYNFDGSLAPAVVRADVGAHTLDYQVLGVLDDGTVNYVATDNGQAVVLSPAEGLALPREVTQALFGGTDNRFELNIRFKVADFGDARDPVVDGVDSDNKRSQKRVFSIKRTSANKAEGVDLWVEQKRRGYRDFVTLKVRVSDRDYNTAYVVGRFELQEWIDLRLRFDQGAGVFSILANDVPVYVNRDFAHMDVGYLASRILSRDIFLGWLFRGAAEYNAAPEQYDATLVLDRLSLATDWTATSDAEYTAALAQLQENLVQDNKSLDELNAALAVVHAFFADHPDGRYLDNRPAVDAFMQAYEAERPPLGSEVNNAGNVQEYYGFPREARALQLIQQAILDHYFVPGRLDEGNVKTLVFDAHRHFPGEVRTDAPRLDDATFELDVDIGLEPMNLIDTDPEDITVTRRPTGYYVAPGEPATACVDAAYTDLGISVVVGAHPFDLAASSSRKQHVPRFARVITEFPLDAQCIEVANPFGGALFVRVPSTLNEAASPIELTLSQVIKAPYFYYAHDEAAGKSQTPIEDWQTALLDRNVPWAHVESDAFWFTLPSTAGAGFLYGQEPYCEDCEWMLRMPGGDYCWLQPFSSSCEWARDPSVVAARWHQAWERLATYLGRPFPRPIAQGWHTDVDSPCAQGCITYPYAERGGQAVTRAQTRDTAASFGSKPLDPQGGASDLMFHEYGHGSRIPTLPGEIEANVQMVAIAARSSIDADGDGQDDHNLETAFRNANRVTISRDGAAMDWMLSPNFRANQPMSSVKCAPDQLDGCDEIAYQPRGYAKHVDLVDLFGWDGAGSINKMFYDQWNVSGFDRYVSTEEFIDAALAALQVNVLPLLHFWGMHPTAAQVATAQALLVLDPAQDPVYQRLLHYRTLPAMHAVDFELWWDHFRDNGLNRASYGVLNYNGDDIGGQIVAQIDYILDTYYPGRPHPVDQAVTAVHDACELPPVNNGYTFAFSHCNESDTALQGFTVAFYTAEDILLWTVGPQTLEAGQGFVAMSDELSGSVAYAEIEYQRTGQFQECQLHTYDHDFTRHTTPGPTVARLHVQTDASGTCRVKPLPTTTPGYNGLDKDDYEALLEVFIDYLTNSNTTYTQNDLEAAYLDLGDFYRAYPSGRYSEFKDKVNEFMAAYEANRDALLSASTSPRFATWTYEDQVMMLVQQVLLTNEFVTGNLDVLDAVNDPDGEGALDQRTMAFEAHERFPGQVTSPARSDVDTGTGRLNGRVSVNATNAIAQLDDFDLYKLDPNPLIIRRATGYYAAPGEIVTVCHTYPTQAIPGLGVHVGAHRNSRGRSWERYTNMHMIRDGSRHWSAAKTEARRFFVPTTVFEFDEACVDVANPLGGGIYLAVPPGVEAGWIELTIDNAVPGARFVWDGENSSRNTSIDEWNATLSASGAPWVDFESPSFRFTFPASMAQGWTGTPYEDAKGKFCGYCAPLEDPAELMRQWELVYEKVALFAGRAYPPARPQVVIGDVELVWHGEHHPDYDTWHDAPFNQEYLIQLDESLDASVIPKSPLTAPWNNPQWVMTGEEGKRLIYDLADLWGLPEPPEELYTVPYLGAVAAWPVFFAGHADLNNMDTAFKHSQFFGYSQSTEAAAIDWMVSPNFRWNLPKGTCNPNQPYTCYELFPVMEPSSLGKHLDLIRLYGWSGAGAANALLQDRFNELNENLVVSQSDYLDALGESLGVNPLPLVHFWGMKPTASEEANAAPLPRSIAMRERLLEYRDLVPPSATGFGENFFDTLKTGLGALMGVKHQWGHYEHDEKEVRTLRDAHIDAVLADYDSEGYAAQVTSQIDYILDKYYPADAAVPDMPSSQVLQDGCVEPVENNAYMFALAVCLDDAVLQGSYRLRLRTLPQSGAVWESLAVQEFDQTGASSPDETLTFYRDHYDTQALSSANPNHAKVKVDLDTGEGWVRCETVTFDPQQHARIQVRFNGNGTCDVLRAPPLAPDAPLELVATVDDRRAVDDAGNVILDPQSVFIEAGCPVTVLGSDEYRLTVKVCNLSSGSIQTQIQLRDVNGSTLATLHEEPEAVVGVGASLNALYNEGAELVAQTEDPAHLALRVRYRPAAGGKWMSCGNVRFDPSHPAVLFFEIDDKLNSSGLQCQKTSEDFTQPP